jgi:hypothetical protein
MRGASGAATPLKSSRMFLTFRKVASVVFVGVAFASSVVATLALHATLTLIGAVRAPGTPRAES